MNYLFVMLGGAIGSAARYQVGRLTLGWLGPAYPWGTLTVNIVGGVLMGLLVGILARLSVSDQWRLFADDPARHVEMTRPGPKRSQAARTPAP